MTKSKIIVYFSNEDKLRYAIDKSKIYNIRIIDIISPFPINNINIESKKDYKVGIISFVFGVIAFVTTLFFQWWTSIIDYPQNIGGKPFFTWIFLIPITYELTLLSAAIGGFIGFLIYSRLPKWRENNEYIKSMRDEFIIILNTGEKEEIFIRNIDNVKVKRTF